MKNVLKKEHKKAFKTNGIMSDIEGKRDTRNGPEDDPVLLGDILPGVMADIRSRMAARKAAENRPAIGKGTSKNRRRWEPKRSLAAPERTSARIPGRPPARIPWRSPDRIPRRSPAQGDK